MTEGEQPYTPGAARRRGRHQGADIAGDRQRGRRGRVIRGILKVTPPAVGAFLLADKGLDRQAEVDAARAHAAAPIERKLTEEAAENRQDEAAADAREDGTFDVDGGETEGEVHFPGDEDSTTE